MKQKHYVALRKKTDFAINKLKNCCKVGCAFCCYQLIEVFDFERPTLMSAIRRLNDDVKGKVKQNLESWVKFYNDNTPDKKILDDKDSFTRLREMTKKENVKHKCPLLIDDKCCIYNSRPLACRVHIVESNPKQCEQEPYRDSSRQAQFVRQDIMFEVKSKGKHSITCLPYIIAEVIKIDLKLKPLKKLSLK